MYRSRRRRQDHAVRAGVTHAERVALFERVYDATAPRAYGLARLIVRDRTAAEEVLRAAYLDLWQHPPDRGLADRRIAVEVLARVQVAARRVRRNDGGRDGDDTEVS